MKKLITFLTIFACLALIQPARSDDGWTLTFPEYGLRGESSDGNRRWMFHNGTYFWYERNINYPDLERDYDGYLGADPVWRCIRTTTDPRTLDEWYDEQEGKNEQE